MADLAHLFGSDLSLSAIGGLALSDGDQQTQERAMRRLMTSPGAYIWNPGYGAGLPAMIGQPVNVDTITGIIRVQMIQEAGVAQSPAPTVQVQTQPGGVVIATISFTSALTGAPVVLTLPVGVPA